MSKNSIQTAYYIMLVTMTAQGFLTQNLSWICNLLILDHFFVASKHPKHHEVLANSCTSVPSPNITKGAPPLTPFTWGSMWHLPPPRGVTIRAQPKNACRKITSLSQQGLEESCWSHLRLLESCYTPALYMLECDRRVVFIVLCFDYVCTLSRTCAYTGSTFSRSWEHM